jgi:4-amino-4-deoxychorismate lyase
VSELSSAFRASAWLHGATAFTTVRTQFGQPLLWPEHLARLAHTCTVLGLPDPVPAAEDVLSQLDPLPEGRLRLTAHAGGLAWQHERLTPLQVEPEGVRLWLSDVQVHPQLAAHKTGNYLPYLLAGRQATDHGCFEALLTDAAGCVVDGSRSSLVLELGGRLIVPFGGLPGVTRAAWLAEWGRPFGTRPVTVADLQAASQLWLAGSGIGVVPVREIQAEGWSRMLTTAWPEVRHPALRPPK